MPDFEVVSPYEPSGDQPEAIDTLVQGLENGIDDVIFINNSFAANTSYHADRIDYLCNRAG